MSVGSDGDGDGGATGVEGRGEDGKVSREFALNRPFGIAFDRDDNMYICDTMNDRIVRIPR